jgi:small nuclear ribonucleoprotein (snRNP)-like protein
MFIKGVLKGFDQATNIILDESHERVYSTKVWMSVCIRLKFLISRNFCDRIFCAF